MVWIAPRSVWIIVALVELGKLGFDIRGALCCDKSVVMHG